MAAQAISPKSRLATALLAFFLGSFGVHRLYIGKTKTGLIMLALGVIGFLTAILVVGFVLLAIVGIWALIDFIMTLVGSMKDVNDLPITKW